MIYIIVWFYIVGMIPWAVMVDKVRFTYGMPQFILSCILWPILTPLATLSAVRKVLK